MTDCIADSSNAEGRLSEGKSRIGAWNAETAPSDEEVRALARKRWEESEVVPLPEKPKRTAPLEDYEIAGVAQDVEGGEIPREGWIKTPFGTFMPARENPLRNQILAIRETSFFKRAQSYLEHVGHREGATC